MPNDRRKILRAIAREGRKIKDPHKRRVYLKSAVETGIVESNLSNPSGGDADSQGWRQERASLYADPTNINAAAKRFRQEFEQQYDPGEKSYDVAAQVQRPAAQYRGRYHDVAGQASQVIKSELGGSQPNQRQGSSTTTYKTTPGVDNSGLRQQAKLAYLSTQGDPDEKLLTLASSLRDAKDTPSTRVKVKGADRKIPSNDHGGKDGIGGPLLELFYKGTSIKNGKPAAPVSGHDDHVHVAAGHKSVIRLGKLAQQMGLTVRENEAFDPVDPVHVKGSYHYSGKAIDVSGDPKKLAAYAKRVRRIYGS